MLSKRVMVVAAEKPLQRRLMAGAMAAGGAVQAFGSVDELPARLETDLVLYAVGWQVDDPGLATVVQRLPEEARLVPILPAPQLGSMIKLLGEARTQAVLAADELTGPTISQVVSKLLYRDLFGVEKLMPWGVRIYSMVVGDYNEKALAIATVSDFAQAMGVRRKHREHIDQCADELLMNALYDAPVDADGKPLFADVPVKERSSLQLTSKAIVQYACDGERFVLSVRDNFGALEKRTVLAYLDKCLNAQGGDQIDRKAGGAGLGLYLIANGASEVYFQVFSGTATEVVCSFALSAPRTQLRALAVFEERLERGRALPSPQAQSARRGRRQEDIVAGGSRRPLLLPAMMGLAVLLLMTAVTLMALPYLRRPTPSTVRVESEPVGANIYVDGRARGTAPLALDGLEAGRAYAIRATLPGHHDDDRLLTAAAGETALKLRLAGWPAQVALESEPPGARVHIDGKDSGKVTPATIEAPPGQSLKVRLLRDGFAPQDLAVVAPPAGERTVYRAVLSLSPQVATLTITAPDDATVAVDGMALLPPGPVHETFVKPGALHHVKVTAHGFVDFRQNVTLAGGERRTVHAQLSPGGVLRVETEAAGRVFVDGHAIGAAPIAPLTLAEGEHVVALKGEGVDLERTITIERGKTTELRLENE